MKIEIIILGVAFVISRLKVHSGLKITSQDSIYEAGDSPKISLYSIFKSHLKVIVPIVCIAIYFIWGIVCFYKGYIENRDFEYIVEYGEKIEATIVKKVGERKSYEPIETRQHIYLVEFFIGGERQQERILAAKYFHSGDIVCIYYLAFSPDRIVNVAIADEEFYPDNNMIHHGISRFGMGFFFYFLLKEILE